MHRSASPVLLPVLLVAAWAAVLLGGAHLGPEWRDHQRVLLAISALAGLITFAGVLAHGYLHPPDARATFRNGEPDTGGQEQVRMRATQYSLPKSGNDMDENEDAASVGTATGFASISDGASSSFNSGRWARVLCERFVMDSPVLEQSSMASWLVHVAAAFSGVRSWDTDADWLDRATASMESHATFLGFRATRVNDELLWQSCAVGDSCVVQLRPDDTSRLALMDSFPVERSGGFAGSPWLVSSSLSSVAGAPPVRFCTGRAGPDDVFLLMTDEMARWSLQQDESASPVWELLAGGDERALTRAINAGRDDGSIVNDDMTVVRLRPVR